MSSDPARGDRPLAPPIDYSQLSTSAPARAPADADVATHPPTSIDHSPAGKTAAVELVSGQSASSTSTGPHPPAAQAPELVDSPAPAEAHPESQPAAASASQPPPMDTAHVQKNDEAAVVDTAKVTTGVSPADQAPAPAAEPAPPAAETVSSADAAPRPAVEAAPVQVPEQAAAGEQPVGQVPPQPESQVVRPPTAQTAAPAQQDPTVPAQVDTVPPTTSKPIVPAAESHLAEHPATSTDTDHVIPLGSDVHPVHQAAALNEAPDHLVNAQVEKHKADKRELYGEEPQGTIVPGLEDDKLWAMLRRFDVVRPPLRPCLSGCTAHTRPLTRPANLAHPDPADQTPAR